MLYYIILYIMGQSQPAASISREDLLLSVSEKKRLWGSPTSSPWPPEAVAPLLSFPWSPYATAAYWVE